jgi:hypothetical protein
MNIPVLVMAFNRPELLRNCLESLQDQGVENLYIALDGPRSDLERAKCDEVLQIAESFRNSTSLKILTRSRNLGCYLGVISNLDWFFSEVSFGIVIEDDCIIDKKFFEDVLDFQSQLSDHIRDGVGMITAHNPFRKSEAPFNSEYSFIQGWAISSKVWQSVRPQLLKVTFPSLRPSAKRAFWENIYWWSNATRAKIGGVDTWDGAFSYAMYSLGLKCLVPAQNQIANYGFGLDATHTTDPYGSILISELPNQLMNASHDTLLRKYYFKLKPRFFFTSLLRLLFDFFRFRDKPGTSEKMNFDMQTRRIIYKY